MSDTPLDIVMAYYRDNVGVKTERGNEIHKAACVEVWDMATKIDELTHDRDRLAAENIAHIRAVEALTPGGSEFAGDFDACVKWAADQMRTTGKVAAERNRLAAEVERLREVERYDVKTYADGMERETIRGLTLAQVVSVESLLQRYGIKHTVKELPRPAALKESK
jgi:hypothetical protein